MTQDTLPTIRGSEIKFTRLMPDPAIPGNILPCQLCGKPFMMPLFSGEPDQICGECMRTYADTAKLVCAKCHVTVCRVAPKLLDNGYYIRPHSILHLSACGGCMPGLKTSEIIEIAAWERTARRGRIIVPMGV